MRWPNWICTYCIWPRTTTCSDGSKVPAQRYSVAGTCPTEYRWPAEVVAAGLALARNGDISEVIKATNGYYLVCKLDARESVTTPMEQVQVSLQRRLVAEKRQQTEAAFRQELRTAAPVQSFPQVLAQVEYPTTVVAKSEEPIPPALPRSP